MTRIIHRTAIGIAAIAMIGLPVAASASAANTNLTVQTTIPATCTFGNAVAITFTNPTGLSVTQTDATGSVDVNCTNGGVWSIAANNGSNYASSTRNMKSSRSGSAAVLAYTLSGAGVGGADLGTTAKTGTGNGSTQTQTLYGRLAAQTATEAGSYTDTVQLTLTY